MRLQQVAIENFRSMEALQLDLLGESAYLVGANARGKTAILTAIARIVGRDSSRFDRRDFRDLAQPIIITMRIDDLDATQRGDFASQLDFTTTPPSVRIGIRAFWDPMAEEVSLEAGFPDHGWSPLAWDQRRHLPVLWLPAWRDPSRLLRLGNAASFLGQLVDQLPNIGTTLDGALAKFLEAIDLIANDQDVRQLMRDGETDLSQLLPDVPADFYSVVPTAITPREVLALTELALSPEGAAVPVGSASSGLSQLTVINFALRLVSNLSNAVVLIDEPETSLHPQVQRALAQRIQSLAAQTIVATHSSNILYGAEATAVFRLGGTPTTARNGSNLSPTDEAAFRRYATPQTMEAFFARSVLLVEGESDYIAVTKAATLLGHRLDAKGVAVLQTGGEGTLRTFVRLFGKNGLDLDIAGLVDADAEAALTQELERESYGQGIDRLTLESVGFWICDSDLEAELIQAVGISQTEALITAEGEDQSYAAFAQDPRYSRLSDQERLEAFLSKRGRKVRYAPLLIDRLTSGTLPRPLVEALNHVCQ